MAYPTPLYKRIVKQSPLTFTEMDDNVTATEEKINGIQNLTNVNADDYIGGSYTLTVGEDLGCLLVCDTTNNSLDIEIPKFSTEAFPVGSHIDVLMYGTNTVTFSTPSATLHSYQNKTTIGGQYIAVTLINLAEDEWLLVGNLI